MPETVQSSTETLTPKPIRGDYTRLSYADIALVLKLSADGKTQTFIAHQIGCSQPTVSKVLHDFSDTTHIARQRANNLSLKAVQKLEASMDAAVQQGKAGPMDSLLRISGLLGSDVSGGVTVIVGGSVDDVCFPVNVIATYQTHTDSEAQTGQALPAPYRSAIEAKAEGESAD